MNIKEDLIGVRFKASKHATEYAEKLVNKICNSIFSIASSEDIISARWIMVHLDVKTNVVKVCLAVREYVLIDHHLNRLFSLFDQEESSEILSLSETHRGFYKQYVYSELKAFLSEQGFVNIETELPFENGKERPDSEYFEWYAFEVL